ncbi:MAG: EboA domain-containing protein [Planctomycetota bacterium]
MLDSIPELCLDVAPADRAWLEEGAARAAREGSVAIASLLPALPRRIGRRALGSDVAAVGSARVDLRAWRACDGAARLLLRDADDAAILDLFKHGDMEERTMLLRAASTRPLSPATVSLLGEVQRSNVQPHYEALVCDNDLLARASGAVAGFGQAEASRLVLKAAFLGLPMHRMLGVERLANPELSRMLQDLATEREAAGRQVWPDTLAMMARAPVPGTAARALGDLEHGADDRRAAAIAALALLNREDLMPFLRERLPREPKPQLRAALKQQTGV